MVQPLWKTIWRFLKKVKIDLPYDPAMPLRGIYPKEMKTGFQQDICTPMFITALFTIAKIWKQLKCPSMDEWIKKMWYIYTVEKENILPFVIQVDLELSEISHTEKDKHCMISLTCGI